jgi:hypothetical protein
LFVNSIFAAVFMALILLGKIKHHKQPKVALFL